VAGGRFPLFTDDHASLRDAVSNPDDGAGEAAMGEFI
jgi:hypothetical protein